MQRLCRSVWFASFNVLQLAFQLSQRLVSLARQGAQRAMAPAMKPYLMCAICHDPMCVVDQHLSSLVCGHTYHSCCIEELGDRKYTGTGTTRQPNTIVSSRFWRGQAGREGTDAGMFSLPEEFAIATQTPMEQVSCPICRKSERDYNVFDPFASPPAAQRSPMSPPLTGGASGSGHQNAVVNPVNQAIVLDGGSDDEIEELDNFSDGATADVADGEEEDEEEAAEEESDEEAEEEAEAFPKAKSKAKVKANAKAKAENNGEAVPKAKSKAKAKANAKASVTRENQDEAVPKAKSKAKVKANAKAKAENNGEAVPKAKSKAKGKANAKAAVTHQNNGEAVPKAKSKAGGRANAKAKAMAGAPEADAPDADVPEPTTQLVVAETVPAVPLPQAVESNDRLATLAFGHVICESCGQTVSFTACRIASKGRGSWKCSVCAVKTTQLRRALGAWPSAGFTSLPKERSTRSER